MPIAVLVVLLSLLGLAALLAGVTWFEQRVLSPRSIIMHTIRVRGARPEHVEVLVRLQSDRLLTSEDRAHH